MSTQVQLRRDTAAVISAYVGAQGELLYSTDDKLLHIQDGTTPGGNSVIAGIAAGGDLAGTYPNPTVAKVNGVPVASLGLSVSFATGVNVTTPVVSYSASATLSGTNVDFALVPSGTGAVQLCIPDGTTAGGNKRGSFAVDLQGASQRTVATQVASGSNSFAAGLNNTASGAGAIAAGSGNSSSNNASIALGNGNNASQFAAVAIGFQCTASAAEAVALGNNANASGTTAFAAGFNATASGAGSTALGSFSTTNGIKGQVAFGHNSTVLGQYQRSFTQLYVSTASTAATSATADGATAATSNQLTLRNNSAYRVRLYCVARDVTTGADAKEWTSDILITRGATASTTAIVGAPVLTSTFATAGASGWTLAVTADTTNGALRVTVTSSTTDTVHWNVQLDSIEVL